MQLDAEFGALVVWRSGGAPSRGRTAASTQQQWRRAVVLRNAASGGVTQPGKFNSCSVAVAGRKRRARCAERGQPVEAVGIVAHFWDCLRCAVGTQDQPNTLCGALTRLVHIQAQIVRAAHDARSVRQTHEQGWPRGRPQRSENSVLHTPPRCHARAAHERKRRRCATRGHARVPISPASSAGFTRRRRMRASSASFHGGMDASDQADHPGHAPARRLWSRVSEYEPRVLYRYSAVLVLQTVFKGTFLL